MKNQATARVWSHTLCVENSTRNHWATAFCFSPVIFHPHVHSVWPCHLLDRHGKTMVIVYFPIFQINTLMIFGYIYLLILSNMRWLISSYKMIKLYNFARFWTEKLIIIVLFLTLKPLLSCLMLPIPLTYILSRLFICYLFHVYTWTRWKEENINFFFGFVLHMFYHQHVSLLAYNLLFRNLSLFISLYLSYTFILFLIIVINLYLYVNLYLCFADHKPFTYTSRFWKFLCTIITSPQVVSLFRDRFLCRHLIYLTSTGYGDIWFLISLCLQF